MGRKKIKIARITDDRNRSVTYLKRKAGLMKKAHELAVLTGSEVAVIVFGQNGKLTEFCSGDMDRVLLRYTEHTGPVERKGPENYQNDDDDSDDDGGDDDDEGAAGGTSGQGYGESAGNGRGSGAGGSGSGPSSGRRSSGAGRNQKRKAPGLRQDFDAQSTSSSTTSSRRGSSPSLSQMGPLIRVDNANAQDTVSGDGVDKDTLKAAIFQRTLSHHRPSQSEDHTVFAQMAAAAASAGGNNGRPINLQHHHSLSTGDYSFLQQHQFSHAVPGVPGPARPSTAGSIGGHGASPAAYGTPQRQASPRFAFPSSPSGFHVAPPTLVGPQQGFLSPQPIMMPPGTSPPAMPVQRAQSVTSLSQPAVGVTYGDLARGGGGAGMSGPRMPALQQSQSTDGFGSDNKATIDHGSTANNHLMPLAHPILRQHPQYETYSMQLRSQQAQGGTVPAIHTAPSSPGIAAEQVQMSAGGGGLPSDGNTLHPMSGISHIKRSASFGAVQPSSGQGHLAQTRFDASPFGSQPLSGTSTPMAHMPSGGGGGGAGGLEDYASLSGGQVSKSFQPPPPYALAESHPVPENAARLNIAATPTTTSRSDHVAVGGQTISNDDFNDLMGSILGDMEAGEADERLATLASTSPADVEGKARPRPIPFANPTASVKDEHSQNDSLMRSLDSEHSLSTLVNSDSFDALFAGGAGGGNPRVGAMKPDDKVTSSLATTTMPNAEKEPTVQAFSGNLHVKGGVKIDDVRAGHVDTQNAI